MDIRPPQKRPQAPIAVPPRPDRLTGRVDVDHQLSMPTPEPLLTEHATTIASGKSRHLKWWIGGIIALLVIIAGVLAAGYMWYQQALRPVSNDASAERVLIQIESGASLAEIRDKLYSEQLIRDKLAFDIYIRLSGKESLQAGSYRLAPTESLPAIVDHLTSGKVNNMTIMFYPGATLRDTSDTPEKQKTDVKTVLLRAGYSDTEIETAFKASYDSPLFAGKPAGADLEGYVYGETYIFPEGATAEQVLQETFDEFYKQIVNHQIVAKLEARQMTLYEGITLASIVQREEKEAENQRQVAQVFHKRLGMDMPLGSDPTYIYGAAKLGITASPDIDSPYNTRKHAGLPPGPISAPNISALDAVVNPAAGDYLYFLSGDDDKLYFANTDEEHQQNIRDHCMVKCFSY